MATYTENYNLIKPDEEDFYDVETFNENMDTLDEAMAEAEQAVEAVSDKIGIPAEAGNTIFSLLEGNTGGLIKSIQKVQFDVTNRAEPYVETLTTTVNPDRCIVLLDRLYDRTGIMKISYTLNADSISLSLSYYTSGTYDVSVLFQIIELY